MNASKRNKSARMCCHNPHTNRRINLLLPRMLLCINFSIKWIPIFFFLVYIKGSVIVLINSTAQRG